MIDLAAIARSRDLQRARIETAGIRLAVRLGRTMLVESVQAWRRGNDPIAPIRKHFQRLIPVIESGSATGYLRSRLTTTIRATAHRRGTGMSTNSAFKEAQNFLKNRMNLSDKDVRLLTERFGKTAARATTEASQALEHRVQVALARTLKKGLHTEEGALSIRRAFGSAGASAKNPGLFETLFRTETQKAYAAGQWEANKQSFVDDILWGYQYYAVRDDRVTELCKGLDGTRRKKGDAFWLTYWPPNHYNCRGEAIEVYKGTGARQTRVPRDVTPIEGFDFNFAEILG